jgi:D-alanyl-D-alanine carboxypeptidase/D-alanyl-D-alanine-endopeptidase (penicillin-binding protein 4)
MEFSFTQTKIRLTLYNILTNHQAYLLVMLLLITSSPFTVASAEETDVKNKINQLIKNSKINEAELGICIEGPGLQYSMNGEKKMKPASVTKVATAAAVLESFPVGYQFLTELKTTAKIINNQLPGDLCLVGGGDAGFVSESMWFLVNEFYRTGVREIKGRIIVDDSFHDQIRFDSSRDQTRVDRAYDSPIGAMTFNWSAVNVFVRGRSGESSASVWADPESDYILVENKTRMGSKTDIQAAHKGIGKDGAETILVTGTKANDNKEFVAFKAVQKPDFWAGHNLKNFLKQRGITVQGGVVNGKCDKSATSVGINKSKTVGELTQLMLKYSNNYIAEILTKNLAAYKNNTAGTMDLGIKEMRSYLTRLGFTEKDFEIYNPSGLSLKNRITAKATVNLLQHIKEDLRIYPEFISGLPIMGVDGTLRKRISNEEVKGLVRAKTGHLTGVSSLAGYVANKKIGIYSFAFYHNGSAEKSYDAKVLFEKLTKELTE